MKINRLFLAVLLSAAAFGTQALAAKEFRLRSNINPGCATSSSLKYADIWADGNIAVMGSYQCRGVFIFDISNPDEPILANWYNPSPNRQFLEAIVIGNRGYFGSGGSGGVHIVDLSDPSSPQLLGVVDSTHGNGYNSIHEMVVFDQNGVRILVENFNSLSGNKILKFINVTDPANPVFIRDLNPTEVQWVHAMHIRGSRMFTSGWGNSVNKGKTEIYDISNVLTQAPTLFGAITDPGGDTAAGNNMHSSWSSEDGNYLYSARETSGSNGPNPGDIRVYDVSNPAEPMLVNRVTMSDLGINAVTPHNPVVMGNKLYVSWYQAGTQVFDISTPSNPKRIGQYDTYPAEYVPVESSTDVAAEPWDILCGTAGLQNALPTNFAGNWAVYPFLGENKVLLGDLATGLYIIDITTSNQISDFDGDGKTDLSVWTPTTGNWNVERSSDSSMSSLGWGLPDDIPVAADYDGDGKGDHAIFRPSTGTWWFVMSSNGSRPAVQFGTNGDIPVTGDFDGDRKTDITVYRPSSGVWYILKSSGGISYIKWGIEGDKPMAIDHDGDGTSDVAVWRPSSGVWYIIKSSDKQFVFFSFGLQGDHPLVADFDGDGRSEYTIYRPSNGIWYIWNPASGVFSGYSFGLSEDIPVPADYDGDGRSDVGVFRPGTNVWYRINSSSGGLVIRNFGSAGDMPSPASVQPD